MSKNETIGNFLDALASGNPTPGGGGAAALIGATGAALVSMVCNLTIGRKKFAEAEEELKATLAKAEALRAELIKGIDDDAVVFGSVMAAYGLPKETDEQKAARTAAIQAALRDATSAPKACAKAAAEVVELSEIVARKGNPNVASDAGVAALAGIASLRSAYLNVAINANAMTDRAFADQALAEVAALVTAKTAQAEEVLSIVDSKGS